MTSNVTITCVHRAGMTLMRVLLLVLAIALMPPAFAANKAAPAGGGKPALGRSSSAAMRTNPATTQRVQRASGKVHELRERRRVEMDRRRADRQRHAHKSKNKSDDGLDDSADDGGPGGGRGGGGVGGRSGFVDADPAVVGAALKKQWVAP
jgi:hypothetical protein